MGNNWRFTVWGVRGSFPMADKNHLSYGGSTSCFCLETGGAPLVLDAGSGLGSHLKGAKRVRLLFSHLHLDHLLGLFSFPPLLDPEAELQLYGPAGLERALLRLLGPPYWPVALSGCRARVRFHELGAGGSLPLGDGLTVTAMEGCHPNGCLYYRLEGDGHSLVYALDCELLGDTAARLAAFARDTDLLVWDASFAPGQLRSGWGHSTWEEGAALGRAAGAGLVLMAHYAPEYDDQFLHQLEEEALRTGAPLRFAREGMEITL